MPFKKVETQIDFPAQERAILEYWQKTGAFDKLRAKNRGKPKWSFLDGPITANNPMGVHHAWGRTYKDAYQRYFAMTGHEERYQNGFDCQGLWVEVEVEKELKLQSKRDIENLVPGDRFASIDKFVQECKRRVDKYAKVQTEQSIRLGYWMDWDQEEDWRKPPDQRRSYFTMSDENNYTIWSFLKKCHERDLVFADYDAMPWCPRCGVGISQMEMHEGYKLVAHRSVFVKFRIRTPVAHAPGSPEFLLVWTTTPWTLSSNVAAAVNPQLTYLRVRHKDEVYVLAKGAFTAHRLEEQFKRKDWIAGVPKLKTIEQILKEKGGYEVLGELPGSALVGWQYDGPFDQLAAQGEPAGYPAEIAQMRQRWGALLAEEYHLNPHTMAVQNPTLGASLGSARDLHRVVSWQEVGEMEGTGIVHIAPGCGKEDFQIGKEQSLPIIAPLNEAGVFLPAFGDLAGRSATDESTTDWILADLQSRGILLAVEKYPHSYPHCWRCKTELLFRLVDEWFIKMSWRDEIKQVVKQATWLPEAINGQARELDWLSNMGDWMISKKRYWGLALPIWVCDDCGQFDVIGSRDELKQRAVEGWKQFDGHSPHRPWIDQVKIRCPKCQESMSRVPDVGNPWLDAGIVPYSTMKYNTDHAYWEKWFPADFITEAFPGQFRNWFYAILAMSTMMTGRTPFKVLLGHAMVRDEKGEEMHKSKGNAIPFEDAAEKMSADLMRWMFCRQNPAANINFGYGPADEVRSKFTLKLWNAYAFFVNYARLDGFDPSAKPVPVNARPDIDRWILSDLQLLIRKARESFESYNVLAFCLEAEKFVDDKLSNWYIRRNRRRFWKSEKGSDKQAAYQTLYTVLATLTKLFAPVMPFLSEAMNQNLVGNKASVHLSDFPVVDEALIDKQLSADMEALLRLVSLGSAARNAVKIKVRQPLAEMKVQPGDEGDQRAVKRFAEQICDELNVKKLTLHEANGRALLHREVKANPKTLGPKFGSRLKDVQASIAAADPADLAAKIQGGQPFDLSGFSLDPADLFVQLKAPDGWSGVADRGTEVIIDTKITEELAREGMARDVVRQVQELRKTANLNMEDRIALVLQTDAATLQTAIRAHKEYIGNETLTVEWPVSLDGDAATADVKIDGQALGIQLRRVAIPKASKPKVQAKSARSVTAVKARRSLKAKPKTAVGKKANTARPKKAKAVQAAAAQKNAKPRSSPKNKPKAKSSANAQTKKAGTRKHKAGKTNNPRKGHKR